MSAYTGYLIRRERLAQNLSQEGLCKGICAVSYLSKIEQGLVEPGQEIIDRLFAALHIDFVRDPELEREAERQMEEFFFLSDADQPYEAQKAFFARHGERLLASEFALDYQVIRLCMLANEQRADEARALLAQLEPFLPCMPIRLRRYALIVKASLEEQLEQMQKVLEQAALLGMDCVLAYWQAICVYRMGRYSRGFELAEKAYSLACTEGNLNIMLWSTHLLGACACNRYDLEQAERYYRRCKALSRGAHLDMSSYANYNLGSTYLEIGEYDKALEYLEKVSEQEGDIHHNALQHQKLAILYCHLGRKAEALAQVQRAREICASPEFSVWPRYALVRKMVRFAELLIGEEGEPSPEYEQLTIELYHATGDAYGHGFKQFYGHYLIQLYKRQRRYKEALRISDEVQSMRFS